LAAKFPVLDGLTGVLSASASIRRARGVRGAPRRRPHIFVIEKLLRAGSDSSHPVLQSHARSFLGSCPMLIQVD